MQRAFFYRMATKKQQFSSGAPMKKHYPDMPTAVSFPLYFDLQKYNFFLNQENNITFSRWTSAASSPLWPWSCLANLHRHWWNWCRSGTSTAARCISVLLSSTAAHRTCAVRCGMKQAFWLSLPCTTSSEQCWFSGWSLLWTRARHHASSPAAMPRLLHIAAPVHCAVTILLQVVAHQTIRVLRVRLDAGWCCKILGILQEAHDWLLLGQATAQRNLIAILAFRLLFFQCQRKA